MAQSEKMVCIFLILSTGSLLPLLYSHSRNLWFLPLFSVFYCPFFVTTGLKTTSGADRTIQSCAHMQQLIAGNEGPYIVEIVGVFSGGSERPIIQNFSFLDNTAPT